jgi:AAA+ ATPase superfamily predicted ATPase
MPTSLRHPQALLRLVFTWLLDSLRLAYWAFFKPLKLNEELRKTDLNLATNVPIWRDARSGLSPDDRRVIFQALVAVALGAIVWPIIGGLGSLVLRYAFPLERAILIALTSLGFGIVGVLFVGISFGITMGPAVSLAGSLVAVTCAGLTLTPQIEQTEQVAGVVTFGLAIGLALGLVLGLAAMSSFTLRPSAPWFGWVCAAGGSLALGVLFVYVVGADVNGLVMSVILAVFFALGFLPGYSLGYRRLPLYLAELTCQIILTGLCALAVRTNDPKQWVRRLYQLSPAHWDELIWFPLWTLDRLLVRLALLDDDRQFALEAIVKITHSFHQEWVAEAALSAIMAHDLRDHQHIPEIARAADQLHWFPYAIDLPSLDLRRTVTLINEVSQNAEAAIRASEQGPGWQINLGKAQANVEALQKTLNRMNRRAAGPLNPIVQEWKNAIKQALEGVPQDSGPVLIENFYIAGNPIQPEQERVFVGREDLFAQIQETLAATQKPTLVLHGQRRTGKSSLLLQLPNRLSAEYVPVYVDLQKAAAAVEGLNRFLYTLASEASRQADEKRRIALPPVEFDDFERRGSHAFYEWLDQTQKELGDRLLLLTLDEFEKIEKAIREGQLNETVLSELRHLIQHRSRWLVFLFAGVRTLDDMGPNWHSHFISVRPIRVSYLDEQAARKLILLPAETHPIQYDEQAVDLILEATHAQPFLVQAVCFDLIKYLNSRERRLARPFGRVTAADAQEAVYQAVRSAFIYFQNLWGTCDDRERLVLAGLAHRDEWVLVDDSLRQDLGEELRTIHQTLERLKQRELVEKKGHEWRLQVPMMRQWIRDEKSLEAVRLASQPLPQASRGRDQE